MRFRFFDKSMMNYLICFFLITWADTGNTQPAIFRNSSLPMEKRVKNLVSQLTLEEKVDQMLNTAPAISRLGIPGFNWWNECLHGIARTPYKVTVYPQAIAMAATFDVQAIKKMAEFTAVEGRAINNDSRRLGNTGMYLNLSYWTPNVNIFRDPRWGRGQETYGEDPFLTASMGAAFVKGLQGEDPKYLMAAACAKHFAIHSGPEHNRHSFNVSVSDYDLYDTYLPAFKKLVVNEKVAGVMCAYNAYNGQPCCGNDRLMLDILRNKWDFRGYVTSDCGGINDFIYGHKTSPDKVSASIDAVLHGTDVECGKSAYKSLVEAVNEGKMSQEKIDESLVRLFMVRFKLGLFDNIDSLPMGKISLSVLENSEHKEHSLKMAEESIVLLRNEANLLPLSKRLKKIAIIGPNADNPIVQLGNYNGYPSDIITPLQAIKKKLPGVNIYYTNGSDYVGTEYMMPLDLAKTISSNDRPGFKTEYFGNRNLSGVPAAQVVEQDIDHNWNGGVSVEGNLQPSDFSVRWEGIFVPDSTTLYSFELGADDGYRLLINDSARIDKWTEGRFSSKKYTTLLQGGKVYKICVEHFQGLNGSSIKLTIGNIQKVNPKAVADSVADADVIIYAGGISPTLEGEEMGVNIPGFNGGDRTSIGLPEVQTRILKAVKSTGKPVVFIMMTGSAIALPWESENIPAIINCWYGGQAAGTAIANVLFGDYNPSGRLPVTFYKSDSDLPKFEDYSMKNRTYRYFNGKPMYGFGYGLSYSRFKYSLLKVSPVVKKGTATQVSVLVTNTGKMDGDEVAQLYISHKKYGIKAPVLALKGFQRVFLKKGESKTLTFNLTVEDLSVVDEKGSMFQPSEKISLNIGGSQPDAETKKSAKTVETAFLLQ